MKIEPLVWSSAGQSIIGGCTITSTILGIVRRSTHRTIVRRLGVARSMKSAAALLGQRVVKCAAVELTAARTGRDTVFGSDVDPVKYWRHELMDFHRLNSQFG